MHHTYLILLLQLFLFQLFQLFYLIFVRKLKYAVQPVSKVDFQTWLSVHSLAYTSALCSIAWVRRQMALRSYSRWYWIRSGVGILARRIWSALNICIKIWWLFWFSLLQCPFTSSLLALNWRYVNKDWYTPMNFQGCILFGAIRNKK